MPNDLQDSLIPDLANFEGPNFIDQKINELHQISGVRIELLIIDNLSSLLRTGDENDAEKLVAISKLATRFKKKERFLFYLLIIQTKQVIKEVLVEEQILLILLFLSRFPQKQSYDFCDLSFEVHFEKTRGAMEEGMNLFLPKMTSYDGHNDLPELFWGYESVENDSTYKRVVDLMQQGKIKKKLQRY